MSLENILGTEGCDNQKVSAIVLKFLLLKLKAHPGLRQFLVRDRCQCPVIICQSYWSIRQITNAVSIW